MTLQLGVMQLMEEATQEAVIRLGLPEGKDWKFKQSVELMKEQVSDDESIRKKVLELERMVDYPPGKLFGILEKASRSRSPPQPQPGAAGAAAARRRAQPQPQPAAEPQPTAQPGEEGGEERGEEGGAQ